MEPPKNRLAGFGARGMASQQPLNVAAMPLPLDVRNDSAALQVRSMCNLHSIAKNQAAIRDLFKVARAAFFLACLAAMELEGVVLEDI
jgi:hypothetical protein